MNKVTELKKTLKEQIDVRKQKINFEKKIDKEQGNVWKKDSNKYIQLNIELKGKNFEEMKKNQNFLVDQIKDNQIKKQQENE